MAVAFTAVALTTDEPILMITYCWVAAVGIALAAIDIRVRRLPDRLTMPLAGGTAGAFGLQAVISGAGERLVGAAVAGIGVAGLYLLLSLMTSGGVGLGDAKLALGLAFAVGWTSWRAAMLATTLGFVLTGLGAVTLVALKRVGRNDALPHGPFVVAAALTTITLLHA